MGCCGDRRRQAATFSMTAPVQSVTSRFRPPPSEEAVPLRYEGDAPVIISGPVSGRLYRIEHDAREVAADRRDVLAFVATGRFSRLTREP